jgi:CPA2 family monovalent cation:H+ antiporter-2
VEETRFFVDLGLVLVGALLGGALAHAVRQPLIVGYVLGGILVGPFTPGPTLSDPHSFHLFAEVGVVLLLFTTGVEFSIGELLSVRRVALFGAPVGIALIVLLTIPVGAVLGWPLAQTLVVGATLSVASTAVILKFLLDRGELTSPHGRVIVGITLMEDLAVVAMTILLPALGSASEERLTVFITGLGRAILILAPLVWLASRAVPQVLLRVARTGNMELFLLVAVVIALGTAALTAQLGLSLALGAFLGGLLISESEFAHEALARILPIRDVFVAMFFVSIGMLVRPESLVAGLPLVLALTLVVIVGKLVVWSGLIRLLGYGVGTAVLAGLGLTQIGEFSYILAGVGRANNLVSGEVYDAILATSLVSILVNALIFRRTPAWIRRILERWDRAAPEPLPDATPAGHVIIFGFGRMGRAVADALDTFGAAYTVVDMKPEATKDARLRGAVTVYGDASNDVILRHAGAERARLAVVAIPDFEAAHRCVRSLRRMKPDLPILVRVNREAYRARMLDAGATEVIQPETEAGLTIVRHSLDRLGVDHHEGRQYLERVRRHWSGTALETSPR